ncbi:MAG: zinc ribbon domain-containing protein [Clostridia bacterium]|nr:zinc ribbon domain-containing protein [Clostridia bacterium]
MIYCMKCGTQLAEGSNFCHICGADIKTQSESLSMLNGEPVGAVSDIPAVNESIPADSGAEAPVNYGYYPENNVVYHEPPANASTYVVSAPVEKVVTTEDDRQKLLDTMRKKLIGEKRVWRIVAIVCLVIYALCIFTAAVSFFSLIFFEAEYSYDDDYNGYHEEISYIVDCGEDLEEEYIPTEEDLYIFIFIASWMMAVYGIYIFVPTIVFGFVMSAKANKVLKTLYIDCTHAYRRCMSPSIIIFSAIFNPLALIFTIPLFRLARNNKEAFEEIASIQHNYL